MNNIQLAIYLKSLHLRLQNAFRDIARDLPEGLTQVGSLLGAEINSYPILGPLADVQDKLEEDILLLVANPSSIQVSSQELQQQQQEQQQGEGSGAEERQSSHHRTYLGKDSLVFNDTELSLHDLLMGARFILIHMDTAKEPEIRDLRDQLEKVILREQELVARHPTTTSEYLKELSKS